MFLSPSTEITQALRQIVSFLSYCGELPFIRCYETEPLCLSLHLKNIGQQKIFTLCAGRNHYNREVGGVVMKQRKHPVPSVVIHSVISTLSQKHSSKAINIL